MNEALFQAALAFCIAYTFVHGTISIIEVVSKRHKQKKERRIAAAEPFFYSSSPWIVERSGNRSEDSPDFSIVADGIIIADVYGHALPHHFLPSRVNARLIAASPDLFRLLEEAHAALIHHPDGDSRPVQDVAATAALLRKVQYGS